MKKLSDKTVNDIVNIILPYPATRVMQISEGEAKFEDEIKLTKRLFELIQAQDYDFQLNLINHNKLEEYKAKFSIAGVSTVRPLHPKQPRYGMQGKFYDYLYVTADIEESILEEFVQKVYEVIKSGGIIIIFTQKNLQTYDRWFNLLQDNFFVAINPIDISEDFHIITARKMHGWGG
ncbi:MAG: hypothetical protein JXQ76_11205 [Campylobacterales bacterium]|nr:hypothetical protein [Campylobacterales bacterium]